MVAVFSVNERMPTARKGVADDLAGAAFRTEPGCKKLSAKKTSIGLHLLILVGDGNSAYAAQRTTRPIAISHAHATL